MVHTPRDENVEPLPRAATEQVVVRCAHGRPQTASCRSCDALELAPEIRDRLKQGRFGAWLASSRERATQGRTDSAAPSQGDSGTPAPASVRTPPPPAPEEVPATDLTSESATPAEGHAEAQAEEPQAAAVPVINLSQMFRDAAEREAKLARERAAERMRGVDVQAELARKQAEVARRQERIGAA